MVDRVVLTIRQRQCLRGKWERKLDKAIAVELGISQRAVEEHLRAARAHFGVGSSVEAAQMAAAAFSWADTVRPQCGPTELPLPLPIPANPNPHSDDAGVESNLVRDIGWNTGTSGQMTFPGRPLRKRGERRNDLGSAARLFWIVAIAGAIPAVTVLLFASTDYLGRFVGDIARLAH